MKVLHVVIDGELAGGQSVALRLIRQTAALGHEGAILSPTRGAFTELAEREGVRVHLLDLRRLLNARNVGVLRRLLRRERIDLVHTHGMVASNVLSRVAARAAGTPVVSHLHGHNVFRAQRAAAAAYRLLDNVTARLCARVIAVSDDTRRRLAEQGVPERLLVTIHNGFDPPPAPVEPDPAFAGGPLVVCAGRLEPAKGQADLLRAAHAFPAARLVLVGRDVGGHRSELERLAQALGIAGRVTVAGPRPDLLPLLAAADVVAVPSWTEGLPVVPLEAMAVRRAVVATAVGGTPEVVADGETGLLVPPRDPARLGAAVAELLEDAERRRRLGEAGHARLLARFSEREMAERVAAVWEEAAA